jgi:hypothetical protein
MANLNAQNRLSKPFVKNSKVIFTLPLGGKIRAGIIALVGTVGISGGATSGTIEGEGGPINLIQRIYVRATPGASSRYPGGDIVDMTPRALLRYAVTQRNGKWIGDLLNSTLGGGAAGNNTIYTPIPIFFADAAQKYSLTTALNTDRDPSSNQPVYASVQVVVETGDLSSCFTGNDRTVDYSGLTVQWIDDRIAIPGDTSVLYQESHEMLIAATNKRALDAAMPQDGDFLSWQILGQQSAALTLSDGLLNRLVAQGPSLDYDKYALDVREHDFRDEWYDPSLTATGMYFIDFTDGAIQANRVPAGSLGIYFDVNNVSGANLDSLEISTRRIYAPTPAKSS